MPWFETHRPSLTQQTSSEPADEDSSTIETFISRKKMRGWVAEDQSKRMFAPFRIQSRPQPL